MNTKITLMFNLLANLQETISINIKTKANTTDFIVKTKNKDRGNLLMKIKTLLNTLGESFETVNNSKSSIGILQSEYFSIIVKPHQDTISNHLKNELKIFDIFDPAKHNKIIFKSADNKFETTVKSMIHNNASKSRCSLTKKVKKQDIYLINDKDEKVPLSIKMDCNGNNFWESADSILNVYAENILNKFASDNNIKSFNAVNLKKDILIPTKNVNLFDCVFGSDVLPRGAVIVSNFDNIKQSKNKLIIHCDAVFTGKDVMEDETYKPVAILMKSKNRNINNPILKNTRVKVVTNKRAKSAININNIQPELIYENI